MAELELDVVGENRNVGDFPTVVRLTEAVQNVVGYAAWGRIFFEENLSVRGQTPLGNSSDHADQLAAAGKPVGVRAAPMNVERKIIRSRNIGSATPKVNDDCVFAFGVDSVAVRD